MDAVVDYIYGLNNSGTYFMNTDVVVVAGANVSVPDIVILSSLTLENNGVVDAGINLCDGCRLEIYNRGVFNANFTLGDGASVVQIISTSSDIKPISVNTDYNLHVLGADGINLSDVVRVGEKANEILLSDSFVVWDVDYTWNKNIRFSGDVKLGIDNLESVVGKRLVGFVDAGGTIQVASKGIKNPMFAIKAYVEDGISYLHLVRETDYTKFMNNNLGLFINSLRDDELSGGLTSALDSAMTMDDINEIIADSMRVAPIHMMDIVALFNAMDVNDFDYETGTGTHFTSVGDSYVYGVFANGGIKVGNISAGIRGYLNSLSLTDSFDSFSGVMFGGNFYAKYERDYNFVRSVIGGNITRFDITNVFDGKRAVDKPAGYSIYGAIDVGHRFDFGGGLIVSPYVGATTNCMTILHMDDSKIVGRVGIDTIYGFDAFGIKYDYGIRASLNTNNEISLGGRIGFMSDFDMVGGHVAVEFLDNEIGRGYKISAGMNLQF